LHDVQNKYWEGKWERGKGKDDFKTKAIATVPRFQFPDIMEGKSSFEKLRERGKIK
jgi:hypothetical protein